MPVTLGCFALAAAGMAGIPLIAGFVSKYYMVIGGIQMGLDYTPIAYYLAGALLVSGVLNVAYFWPVVYTAFFEAEDDHDAKPLVDYAPGGERRSVLPETDGGSPIDDAEDDDDEDTEDIDVDPSDLQPDFSGESVERDYSQPAPRVEGEYAVDQNPSDHTVPEEGEADGDADAESAADERPDGHEPAVHEHEDHHEDHHHEGPPAGGWQRLSPREALVGTETTWFMLGPIVAAVTGAILLGVVPSEAVFLDLIEVIVDSVLQGTEVAR
jgi:multicomponent Na+:H+ antiporter subunit D